MYVCPNCGQNLKFDIARQMMHCDYCDTVMDPYAITEKRGVTEYVEPTYTEETGPDGETKVVSPNAEFTEAANVEMMEVTSYICPQCGGEIVGDTNEAMVFCSYCGASTPLNPRMTNMRRPEMIIPFSKTKQDCATSYVSLLKKALFAPKELKDPKQISGFRAIYMPYWLYDFKKQGPATYKGEHCYHRGNYDYTDHYSITTSVDMEYDGVNYDASSSFSDTLSQAISPYDTKYARPFTTAFMSGFYADTMDVSAEVYEKQAKKLVSDHAADILAANQKSSAYTIKKDTVSNSLTPITKNKTLAMMPVWFMSYQTRDKKGNPRVLYAVVNGQTGKTAADLPVDVKKFLIGSLILALPLFLIFNLILNIPPLYLAITGTVISLICLVSLTSQAGKIAEREMGADDAGQESVATNKKQRKEALKRRKAWEVKDVKRVNRPFYIIPIVICAFLLLLKPDYDYWYYAGVIISGICDCFMMTDIMRRYNKLVTRPLPQFNRKGGDDSAEELKHS